MKPECFVVNSKPKTWTLLLLMQSAKWSSESFLRTKVTTWSPRTPYNGSRTHDFDTALSPEKDTIYICLQVNCNKPSLCICFFWHSETKEQKTILVACCIILLSIYIFVVFNLWHFHGIKIFCLTFQRKFWNIWQMWYVTSLFSKTVVL